MIQRRISLPRIATARVCSQIAYESVQPDIPDREAQVLAFIRDVGGATADEVYNTLGMRQNTVSSLIAQLAKAGKLMNSKSTRRTTTGRPAIVWKIATP